MIDLDQELTELGAHWRAIQPEPNADIGAAVAPTRRRGRVLMLAAATIAVAAVTGIALVATRDDSTRSVRIPPHTTPSTRPTPTTTKLPPTEPAPGVIDFSPQTTIISRLAASDGTIWATGYSLDSARGEAPLFAFDARTGNMIHTFQVPVAAPFALNVTTHAIWIRGEATGSTYLVKLDGNTGTVLGSRQLTLDGGLAVTDTAVWALDGSQLLRIDPNTLQTVATVPLPGGGLYPPTFVAAGRLGIWLASPYDGNVSHVNTTTNTIDDTIHAGDHLSVMVELNRSLWVLDNTNLVQIDPATHNVVRQVALGRRAYDLTTDGTYLYVATIGPGTAQRVDPATGAITPIGVSPLIKSAANITYDATTKTIWVSGGTLAAKAAG